ncbi:uncharacterized protein LY79DRAFT_177091 [Colletotrichum navitas]|uniref:Uncharacterized protein n=1 Tax=Colletotrichum navitas TaxID=681940 RepID=A0AAD8Q1E7_9PEZI|nr:uncharacterized protein LY79DRAFT_177091 [Colletotrichum navitas]KAK1593683.1 hypothetical protein LY79DRAFT_177091 [Colletotrichum navitas]
MCRGRGAGGEDNVDGLTRAFEMFRFLAATEPAPAKQNPLPHRHAPPHGPSHWRARHAFGSMGIAGQDIYLDHRAERQAASEWGAS